MCPHVSGQIEGNDVINYILMFGAKDSPYRHSNELMLTDSVQQSSSGSDSGNTGNAEMGDTSNVDNVDIDILMDELDAADVFKVESEEKWTVDEDEVAPLQLNMEHIAGPITPTIKQNGFSAQSSPSSQRSSFGRGYRTESPLSAQSPTKIPVAQFAAIMESAEKQYDVDSLVHRLGTTPSGQIPLKRIHEFDGMLNSKQSNKRMMDDLVRSGLESQCINEEEEEMEMMEREMAMKKLENDQFVIIEDYDQCDDLDIIQDVEPEVAVELIDEDSVPREHAPIFVD